MSRSRRAFERVVLVGVVCDFMFVLLLYYHYLGGIHFPRPQTRRERMLRDSHFTLARAAGAGVAPAGPRVVCASVSHLSLDVKESRR